MKALAYYKTKGLWWFRVFGYGIHYKNIELHFVLFSERNGFRKKLKIRSHWLELLKPEKRIIIVSERKGGKMEEIRQYYTEENN